MIGVRGRVNANVSILPKRSQIFVFLCAITSIFCLGACFSFIWFEKRLWEIPLWAAGTAGVMGFVCWLISHKKVDMAEGKPTEIVMSSDRLSVTVDPRSQIPLNILQQFSNYLQGVSNRSVLPSSSGMVNEAGEIIQGSESTAREAINLANKQAAAQTEELAKLLGGLPVSKGFDASEGTIVPNFENVKPGDPGAISN